MRYVALLRGIGPINPNMRNAKLRGVLEDLGFQNVETVITTGNVMFDAPSRAVRRMETRIEAAWTEQLGFRSTTIIRSRSQIAALVARNPFGDRADAAGSSCEVTFLKDEPTVEMEVPYTAPSGGYTIVSIEDRAICSIVDLAGSATTDLMRMLEKTYGKQVTTRTWKTVHRILRRLG